MPRYSQGLGLLDGAAADGRVTKNALANLQIRLPAIVIGGGLTAIDTASFWPTTWCRSKRRSHAGKF